MIQSWGNDGRLANRRLETSATSVRLSSLTYGYDNNDNFTSIADTLDATKSRTYAYDAMDRLSRITGAPAPFAREDYIHDKNGNRLAVERRTTATTVPATQTDTYTIAANTNRLTSLATTTGTYSYSHDAQGNQSVEQWPDGSVIMVAYDGFARLTRYKVGLATQDMRYNGADERISVVTTPAVGVADTRIYMYDLDHRIVGEYGAAGVTDIRAEYIWTLPEVGASGPTGGDDGAGGYMPLAIVSGTTPAINWVHSHHNAKPILLTNNTGTVVAYPGHAVLGFPGQFANAVGLAGAQYYYNRYRDYNDATGRYIQADPIGLAGGSNPFSYAMGNALKYMDPMGLAPVCNFSNRPVRVGGTVGSGHGHPGQDRWSETTLAPGQCVSKWEPRMGSGGMLSDIDAVDLDCDRKLRWPGTRGPLVRLWEYTGGEAVRGSDTATAPFLWDPRRPAIENQFFVLGNHWNNRMLHGFRMLGPGKHSR